MMKPALTLALALAACSLPGVAAAQAAPTSRAAQEGARLRKLFADADEADLKLSPLTAISRGDLRYADRLGDLYTDRLIEAERRQTVANLAGLARINRAALLQTDRIAYDVFRTDQRLALKQFAPAVLAVSRYLSINHFGGLQTWYPDFASGSGAAPFKTVADYDNNLKRNAQYAEVLGRVAALAQAGIAHGVVQPKLIVRNVIGQLDALIAQGVEKSPFYAPVLKFPDQVTAADRTRLTAAYAAQVRDVIQPAHRRLRDFLVATYLPAARDTIGLAALPGGATYYRAQIEAETGLPLDPEELHALGLREVARDLAELDRIKAETRFSGTTPAFFEFLRADPRFQPRTADQVREGYQAIARRVDARVREQFSLLPKTAIELRPVPDYRAAGAAPGSYASGTPDGSRPGVFYYNTYDLPSRATWLMEDLYLHEAVPGHHFQISLAQENAALPAFMRFDGNGAFVEGWGLYAEHLGPSLGLMTDPYQRVGGVYGDLVRALRLVVDTGIHAKGWDRERAIAYMLANGPLSRTAATAEVERYVAVPAQAVSYKVGQLTIERLKQKAQQALGPRFDIRAFHAQVLDTGALPMSVLEAKIDAWIATPRGRP